MGRTCQAVVFHSPLKKKASYYIYLAWIIENLQLQEVLIKIKPRKDFTLVL